VFDASKLFNQNSDQALKDFNDVFNQVNSKETITRAQAKLLNIRTLRNWH
jgi:hypothetical protein